MKKPDDFELFHQRRKRVPLAEITYSNNVHKPQLNGKHREKPSLKTNIFANGRSKPNNNSIKIGELSQIGNGNFTSREKSPNHRISRRFAPGTASLNENQENVHSTASSNSISDISRLSEKARKYLRNDNSVLSSESHKSKQLQQTSKTSQRIPITQIHQLVSSKMDFQSQKSLDPYIYNPLLAHFLAHVLATSFNSGISQSTKPTARYNLLQSLVDYNEPVEKSNRVIRSFFDQMRLCEPKKTPEKVVDKKHESILSPDGKYTTLLKVTKLGPFLLAATTSDDEDILLMNTHEIQLAAGSKISLGEFQVHELAGGSKKAYYKWQEV